MRLAQVVGNVISTVKDASLQGRKLLLIKPMTRQGRTFGRVLVALDSVGAGVGERVYFVRSKEAAFPWHPEEIPTDCTVIGILDPYNFKSETMV